MIKCKILFQFYYTTCFSSVSVLDIPGTLVHVCPQCVEGNFYYLKNPFERSCFSISAFLGANSQNSNPLCAIKIQINQFTLVIILQIPRF